MARTCDLALAQWHLFGRKVDKLSLRVHTLLSRVGQPGGPKTVEDIYDDVIQACFTIRPDGTPLESVERIATIFVAVAEANSDLAHHWLRKVDSSIAEGVPEGKINSNYVFGMLLGIFRAAAQIDSSRCDLPEFKKQMPHVVLSMIKEWKHGVPRDDRWTLREFGRKYPGLLSESIKKWVGMAWNRMNTLRVYRQTDLHLIMLELDRWLSQRPHPKLSAFTSLIVNELTGAQFVRGDARNRALILAHWEQKQDDEVRARGEVEKGEDS
ncbi:MAG: hypothetical protein ABIB97_02225 [Patescibacteria group bacterium]